MVIDTIEQGQIYIAYLQSQNIGHASFMILQKIAPSSGMQPITMPKNVPPLFGLVKPKDPRFATVFYKALGNTLVAENMDQANHIAYGQHCWKVVTPTGQLIELSGMMSGGDGQLARGGMSSKLAADAVRQEVLRGYEKDSEDTA
jgi:structural maintenance of chromosome 4